MTAPPQHLLDKTFAALEAAAAAGERCPQNYPFGPMKSGHSGALAKAGRIRVEIFHPNWRVVTIMDGPHRGKRTAPAPLGGKPYKTVYKDHAAKISLGGSSNVKG